MTTITPRLGIGDLIVAKMIEVSNGLHIQHININKNLIETYSSDYNKKVEFIRQLVGFLFPDAIYTINNIALDFVSFRNTYTLKPHYLYDKIDTNMLKHIQEISDDCIVFHTKLRHDSLIEKFNNYILPELTGFLRSFKTSKKIVIVGEREIGINYETTIHKTKTLYSELLLLRNNNNVIDLTKNQLTEGGAFDEFLTDIEIINKCACNITFGIGGPFALTVAFSKNNIAFIPFLHESLYASIIQIMHNNICETVTGLEEKLNGI